MSFHYVLVICYFLPEMADHELEPSFFGIKDEGWALGTHHDPV